jgi:hypothetical protein
MRGENFLFGHQKSPNKHFLQVSESFIVRLGLSSKHHYEFTCAVGSEEEKRRGPGGGKENPNIGT